jgi:hypothetical protein
MWNFSLCLCPPNDMMEIQPNKHKEDSVKKTHLLTKPTRVQDINFDDLDDGMDARWTDRAEKSRIRSYRKLRHQES